MIYNIPKFPYEALLFKGINIYCTVFIKLTH